MFSVKIDKKQLRSIACVLKDAQQTGMSMQLTQFPCVLSPEEADLLQEAHLNWNDLEKFPEVRVKDVKNIIRKIFGLDPEASLLGVILQDAIVLRQGVDNSQFYALVKQENDEKGWDALNLGVTLGTIMFYKNSSFKKVLEYLYLTRSLSVVDSPESEEQHSLCE